MIVVSVLAGGAAIVLLLRGRFGQARIASAAAVATILVGWAVAQYPYMLPPTLTIADAAAGEFTLSALLVALVVSTVVLLPSLVYLYVLFQRPVPTETR